MAEEQHQNPIIFTSRKKASPKRGDWAGVVILEKHPTNSSYNGTQGVAEIEGEASTMLMELGLYRWYRRSDNSGILKYVRIEYAGYAFFTR